MNQSAEGGDPQVPLTPEEARNEAILASPEFQELRRRFRGWVIPVAVAALSWYFGYVLLAAYASGFMGQQVLGNINLGLVLGFAQFLTTFLITTAYVRYADRVLDPLSAKVRLAADEMGAQ